MKTMRVESVCDADKRMEYFRRWRKFSKVDDKKNRMNRLK